MEGLQTKDFRDRLDKGREDLPAIIIDLAEVLTDMIENIERPTRGDIARLHGRLRDIIGIKARLVEVCGNEGELCTICPFMAYVPTEINYASESQPLCLPWIALNRE